MRCVVAALLLAACSSDLPEDLPSCMECGPGAIKAGRFISGGHIAVNRRGTIVFFEDGLVWLDPELQQIGSTQIERSPMDLAIADDDSVAFATGTRVEEPLTDAYYVDTSVVSLAPDRSTRWRLELGRAWVSIVATPDVVVLVTNAQHINGVPIQEQSYDATAVLRASDGALLWHKPITHKYAVGGDGSLFAASSFGYVASLDPLTGAERWVIQDPGGVSSRLGSIAISPSGEVAVTWPYDSAVSADLLSVLDTLGNVKWTRSIRPPRSFVTDGERVIGTGYPSKFVQYSASGVDWEQPVVNDAGFNTPMVLGLANDRLYGTIETSSYGVEGPATTTIGDVTYSGDGLVIVELAH
jgi:hypothetical protein